MSRIDAWNANASPRHEQIASGLDLSFVYVLMPTMLTKVGEIWNSGLILEIGCGTGELTNELASKYGPIIGVDPALDALKVAYGNRLHNEQFFVCAKAEDFLLPAKRLATLVVSNMTLHVIKSLEVVVKTAFTNLRDGGEFLFSIPHPYFYPDYRKDVFPPDFKYSVCNEYTIPFVISSDPKPLPSAVSYFHRPLEKYIQVLDRVGFKVTSISEPMPASSLEAEYPGYLRAFSKPRFMFICAEKVL